MIFVGCTALIASGIRGHLPKKLPVVELTEYDQVQFDHLPGFRPRPLEVQVSTEATAFDKDVIAVEDGNPISLLIAKNLASASGASLFLMPYVSDRAWKDNVRLLRKWANDNDALERENARVSLFETIVAQVGRLLQSRPPTITFFTSGTPYGVYPFDCPTTHLFTYPLLGVNLFLGLAKSLNDAIR